MTWEELHKVEDIKSIKDELTEQQIVYMSLAMNLDTATALILVTDFDFEKAREINSPTKLAEKLEQIYGDDFDEVNIMKCLMLLDIEKKNEI